MKASLKFFYSLKLIKAVQDVLAFNQVDGCSVAAITVPQLLTLQRTSVQASDELTDMETQLDSTAGWDCDFSAYPDEFDGAAFHDEMKRLYNDGHKLAALRILRSVFSCTIDTAQKLCRGELELHTKCDNMGRKSVSFVHSVKEVK